MQLHEKSMVRSSTAKRRYFDSVAMQWDLRVDLDHLHSRLASYLKRFSIRPEEHLLDVGCGTGNFTAQLIGRLSHRGRVVGIDFSLEMVHIAKKKVVDDRAAWIVSDAADIPFRSASFDRILCFSTWPHLSHPDRVLGEFRRVLKEDGQVHILHVLSRDRVNAVHVGIGDPLGSDLLPHLSELAEMFAVSGFEVIEQIDSEDTYLLSARKAQ